MARTAKRSDEPANEAEGGGSEVPFHARFRPPRLGPTKEELTPRLREVIAELETIFTQEGFADFTLGDLAARLHCSRRTFYELAPTKDELVLVVIDRWLRRGGMLAHSHAQEQEKVADKIRAYLEKVEVQYPRMQFARDVQRTPAVKRLFADHYRYGLVGLRSLIDEGVRLGEFRPVNSFAVVEMIEAAVERLHDAEVMENAGLTFGEGSILIADIVFHGLLTPAGRKAQGPPLG